MHRRYDRELRLGAATASCVIDRDSNPSLNVCMNPENKSAGMSQAGLDALVKNWRNEGRIVNTYAHEGETAGFRIGKPNL